MLNRSISLILEIVHDLFAIVVSIVVNCSHGVEVLLCSRDWRHTLTETYDLLELGTLKLRELLGAINKACIGLLNDAINIIIDLALILPKRHTRIRLAHVLVINLPDPHVARLLTLLSLIFFVLLILLFLLPLLLDTLGAFVLQ